MLKKRSRSKKNFFPFCAFLTDKLTKEEEEIYKLQLDLDRMAISQQQSKKISEVSSPRLNIQHGVAGALGGSL